MIRSVKAILSKARLVVPKLLALLDSVETFV